MNTTIAIGLLGVVMIAGVSEAQSTAEQAGILREFDRNVVEYARRYQCLDLCPAAVNAATTSAPNIFTLPVAMVVRQRIAHALGRDGATAIGGVGARHRVVAMQPLPARELTDFPAVLHEALPALPAPIEYRLIGNDLILRDASSNLVVDVLRDALGNYARRH
jgi:hypothetical protein